MIDIGIIIITTAIVVIFAILIEALFNAFWHKYKCEYCKKYKYRISVVFYNRVLAKIAKRRIYCRECLKKLKKEDW